MIIDTSSGGVVFYENKILLLKKNNKIWVLPKGRQEKNEDLRQTAVREVKEETSIDAEIVKYIGEMHYTFQDQKTGQDVHKIVHWYIMKARDEKCAPQREEGFTNAVFVDKKDASSMAAYENERHIIENALKIYNQ